VSTTVLPTARMGHPALIVDGALNALHALHKSIAATGLDPKLVELVSLRQKSDSRQR